MNSNLNTYNVESYSKYEKALTVLAIVVAIALLIINL